MVQVSGQLTDIQAESFGQLCMAVGLSIDDVPVPLPSTPLRAGMILDQMARDADARNLITPRWEGMTDISVGPARFYIRDLMWAATPDAPPQKLTEKERDLIMALFLAPENSLSREDLLDQVWGYRPDLDTHTLETHIYRLRHKIEADPTTPQIVITIPNGYRLQT